jgi:cytochrome c553
MKFHKYLSLGLVGMLAFSSAYGAEVWAKKEKQLCSICHGPGGTTSSDLFPQLAGQPAPYLVNQMKGFRDKSRADENAKRFMWGISSRLSDDDIQQLATYYEAQTPLHQGKISDQAKYDAGKKIFMNGLPEKSVPACMACHGEKGEGKAETPRLGGQHEAYLKRQLKVFYTNDRPAATAMHEVVKGLTEGDVEAIAQYLQAQ